MFDSAYLQCVLVTVCVAACVAVTVKKKGRVLVVCVAVCLDVTGKISQK